MGGGVHDIPIFFILLLLKPGQETYLFSGVEDKLWRKVQAEPLTIVKIDGNSKKKPRARARSVPWRKTTR